MSLGHFHPIIARWFRDTFGEPTVPQQLGWQAIAERRHTLIAAPTGSGKTLAAFLTALDDLFREGLEAGLPDEIRVVYVSPLKALSADIHKNLAEPRRAIGRIAEGLGLPAPGITAAVRTGDTSPSERAAMLRKPPHILVTTPESLYLLLTAARSREVLRTARTVIVDEIHAVIGTRRGAHLALSLERLDGIVARPLMRLGLSATQRPIEEVARFLSPGAACAIVDAGHRRTMDVAIALPGSSLEAVMSHEVWEEYYDALTRLVNDHRTTLVFVNTRRMAERLARHLSDRLGSSAVTAHHGSLSRERRLDAEARLKKGELRALVATASLELGIDIGSVDLVCQIGSPHRIATLLQRVGRSGHSVSGTPKGRLFPVSRDDLVECVALVRAVGRGELDCIVSYDAPFDVLAQQMVAETACCEYGEDELFALVRRAWPYRNLTRPDFDAVLTMIAEGFTTRRGRQGALVHRDEVNRRVRARRRSRMLALTSGGAIPEIADYRVVLDPDDTFIGTLNEDFAIESTPGDIFQLGNMSWQILRVGAGSVRVADAKGAPPTIPFWLGEAPSRSDELSRAVSDLRADVEDVLVSGNPIDRLVVEAGVSRSVAEQTVAYLADSRRSLGVLPTQQMLVLERFFDESGGMQLVLHAPFGSRINRAWALALRKRFCRQFNFELQASATEDALLLSLGPQHSFPLADVFRYLHPATARDVLVQALLDAPMFQTRWRWNATISLAVPRAEGGRKVAPQLQRMLADDLLAAAFPDAAACLENVPGDRRIPDHPLVAQTVRDCLEEAMDFEGLARVLERIHREEIRSVAVDTPQPSLLSHEILNARPYTFLDDAPLEERRARAVYARRTGGLASAGEAGSLDPSAIQRVRDEARPSARDADELHDALTVSGFLTGDELRAIDPELGMFGQLTRAGRAARARSAAGDSQREWYIASERLPELRALHPSLECVPAVVAPGLRSARAWPREAALVELLRGRLSITGPATAPMLARTLGVEAGDVDGALVLLESEGVVLRGSFQRSAVSVMGVTEGAQVPGSHGVAGITEWCDRRLLARIHRYTIHRLRAEIEPVSPADFMRFLFAWHHVTPERRLAGIDGLRAIIDQLHGFEAPAAAWERAVLPARIQAYDASLLDVLCLTGEVFWARASLPSAGPTSLVGASPVALFLRERPMPGRLPHEPVPGPTASLNPAWADLNAIVAVLRDRGASFACELASACGMDEARLGGALAGAVAAGLVTSDGFGGLRSLIGSDEVGSRLHRSTGHRDRNIGRHRSGDSGLVGRWSALEAPAADAAHDASIEAWARALLRRYGIVFRRLLSREACPPSWRELVRTYRWLEARGEIRGGRFVSGMTGEQFALPDAVEAMREIRRSAPIPPASSTLRTPLPGHRSVVISAADPLNLAGIVTAGDRVRVSVSSRVLYWDGVPIAALEGEFMRTLAPVPPDVAPEVASLLTGRRRPPVLNGYIGAAR
jgi:ATP-dependent Lhr-like helicase